MLGFVKQEPHIIWPHHPTQLISEYLHTGGSLQKCTYMCGLYTKQSIKGNLHSDAPGAWSNWCCQHQTTQHKRHQRPVTTQMHRGRVGLEGSASSKDPEESICDLAFKGWYFRFSLLFLLGRGGTCMAEQKTSKLWEANLSKKGMSTPSCDAAFCAEKTLKMTFRKKSHIFGYTSSTETSRIGWSCWKTSKPWTTSIKLLAQIPGTIVWVKMFWEVYAPLKPLHLKVSKNCFPIHPWSLT